MAATRMRTFLLDRSLVPFDRYDEVAQLRVLALPVVSGLVTPMDRMIV